MAPRLNSRFQFTSGIKDADDRMFLTERTRFTYQDFNDNMQHVVREGDTLFLLAARYFQGFPRPAGLWWIIADFQPDPIFDPTIQLEAGRVLIIPSMRTVHEEVFSEKQRLAQ